MTTQRRRRYISGEVQAKIEELRDLGWTPKQIEDKLQGLEGLPTLRTIQRIVSEKVERLVVQEEKRRTATIDEWAKAFGIGRALAYTLAKRGEIPGLLRLGSRYVVSRVAMERMLAGEREEGSGEA